MSKAKEIVKKLVAPKSTFGTNPFDPWSAKADIAESSEQALLMKYLYSRGINPGHVTKDIMIGHSKSGEFMKWKRDHRNMSTEETIQELSKDTLYSYSKKSDKDATVKHKELGSQIKAGNSVGANKTAKKIQNRLVGSDRAETRLNSEDVEQIDELSIDKVKNYNKALKTAPTPNNLHKAIMRFRGKERAQDRIHSDEIKSMRDRLGIKNESLSRSAQLVKSIYQEELYDHEKEDKSVATYGKKPNMAVDGKQRDSKKTSGSRATLTGGTTLTGQKRDTVELDPLMRNHHPNQSDSPNPKDGKLDMKKHK